MKKAILLSIFTVGFFILLYYSLSKTYYSGPNEFRWTYNTASRVCVTGKVLNKITNRPISGEIVTVTSSSGDVSSYTDANGNYFIEVGEYEISMIKVKSISMEKKLNCKNGLTIDIYIVE